MSADISRTFVSQGYKNVTCLFSLWTQVKRNARKVTEKKIASNSSVKQREEKGEKKNLNIQERRADERRKKKKIEKESSSPKRGKIKLPEHMREKYSLSS